jgi:hypothetical protein
VRRVCPSPQSEHGGGSGSCAFSTTIYDDAGKNETNDLKSVVLYHHNIIIKQQSTSHTNQTKPNQTNPNQTNPPIPAGANAEEKGGCIL